MTTAPTAYALSTMYSQLLGRQVGFKLKIDAVPSKARPIFGVYSKLPAQETTLVRADLALLGSLAGILVGLPALSIADRLEEPVLDELLGDAIHELFNITSTPLSVDTRVVFKTMHSEAATLPSAAIDILYQPMSTSRFEVTVPGYPGGQFQVLS